MNPWTKRAEFSLSVLFLPPQILDKELLLPKQQDGRQLIDRLKGNSKVRWGPTLTGKVVLQEVI